VNWYKISYIITASKKDDYLRSIGVSEDVIAYINSIQDISYAQLLINQVRLNPSITTNQLQSVEQPQKQGLDWSHELNNLGLDFSQPMVKWIISRILHPARHLGNHDYIQNYSQAPLGYRQQFKDLLDNRAETGSKLAEIRDWFNAEQPDIASLSWDQAIAGSKEWHEMMAAQGAGKRYDSTNQEKIVHGPQWLDENGNKIEKLSGWTIQQLHSENDFTVEGNKMDHCVGSYCGDYKRGNVLIFSLRDPSNEPHVTVETDGTGQEIEQIQGKSNSIPKPEYKAMIKNWITLGENPPTSVAWDDTDSVYNLVNEYGKQAGGYGSPNPSTVVEELYEVMQQDKEYGFPSKTVDNTDISAVFDTAKKLIGAYHDRDNYYQSDGGFSDLLVEMAMNSGKSWTYEPQDIGIWTLLNEIEELNEEGNEWYVDYEVYGMKYPQEEDFEDAIEYEKAMDSYYYEEGRQEAELFPFAWTSEIYKKLVSAIEKTSGKPFNTWYENFTKDPNYEKWQEKKKGKPITAYFSLNSILKRCESELV